MAIFDVLLKKNIQDGKIWALDIMGVEVDKEGIHMKDKEEVVEDDKDGIKDGDIEEGNERLANVINKK